MPMTSACQTFYCKYSKCITGIAMMSSVNSQLTRSLLDIFYTWSAVISKIGNVLLNKQQTETASIVADSNSQHSCLRHSDKNNIQQ